MSYVDRPVNDVVYTSFSAIHLPSALRVNGRIPFLILVGDRCDQGMHMSCAPSELRVELVRTWAYSNIPVCEGWRLGALVTISSSLRGVAILLFWGPAVSSPTSDTCAALNPPVDSSCVGDAVVPSGRSRQRFAHRRTRTSASRVRASLSVSSPYHHTVYLAIQAAPPLDFPGVAISAALWETRSDFVPCEVRDIDHPCSAVPATKLAGHAHRAGAVGRDGVLHGLGLSTIVMSRPLRFGGFSTRAKSFTCSMMVSSTLCPRSG